MIRIFTLLFSLIPFFAFAGDKTYTLIAPIGTLSGAVTLQTYLEGAFTTIIGIAGILAVLMLVICGIKLMGTGSVSAKSEAKQCIYNAIFGLLLALSSWIILNTINPMLLRSDAELAVAVPSAPPAAQSQGGVLEGGQVAPGDDPMPTEEGWYYRYKVPAGNVKNSTRFDTAQGCLSVQEAQEQTEPASVVKKCFQVEKQVGGVTLSGLSADEKGTRNALCGNDSCVSESSTNVYINNAPCPPGSAGKGCTNVTKLPTETVNMVKSLASKCGCRVTITGGTEPGHQTHGPNNPQIDITLKNPTLNNYIQKNATASRAAGGNAANKYAVDGWWFVDEKGAQPHWHICPVGYVQEREKWCGPI